MKRIELTISPTGESKLQTIGFEGTACEAASRQLIASLGNVEHQQRTAEYYAVSDANNEQHLVEPEES